MNDDEKLAKYFLETYELEVSLYTKEMRKSSRTPDFRVTGKDGFHFLCEVKSIYTETTENGILYSTIYNRIIERMEAAYEQFFAVNSRRMVPNILIFISHNFQIHYRTFEDLFKGGFFIGEEEIANFIKYRDGKFKKILPIIDLIILLDENSKPDYFFLSQDKSISERFIRIFNVDRNNINILFPCDI